ncbi:putative S-methyl-5'-thioadenosine phosphorylase [Paratrimastix pyriformis]|uniref:S-methyl-5'-thioadenosine phosphorylase n=1 Tax=Paratrimastix pyriformis TaxID=342808 RepID=A0ABQ8UTJ7_9EUKA|nr:putative S-methyl-5'-thioadenosine phosphorylase [Paratrimastix pyriformis]
MSIVVGIIGGTGLEDPSILTEKTEKEVMTKYGAPSGPLTCGKIAGVRVVILPRHGKDHRFSPSDVPYLANIAALKAEGVTHIIAATACGSLQEEMHPGDLCILDQFIDRTTKRPQTFAEPPTIYHLPMADPFCAPLRRLLSRGCEELHIAHHDQGTMVTIEGPRFSTRAESRMFRAWGGQLINMTTVPEVVLAREAGIHYAAVGLVTDYDSWRECAEHVTIEHVFGVLRGNAQKTTDLIKHVLATIGQTGTILAEDSCDCATSAEAARMN